MCGLWESYWGKKCFETSWKQILNTDTRQYGYGGRVILIMILLSAADNTALE